MNDADKRIAADLLFKRLLLKPDDLAAGFQYAQLETELGDYEAAIGALERILLQPKSSPGEAPTRRALFPSPFL